MTKQELLDAAEECAQEARRLLVNRNTANYLNEWIKLGTLYVRLAEAKAPDTPTS